ncbi:probable methyltransferase At1g29790 [Arachis stenosperma]|uniref:probable methyltransferase At1g29790 n=1 Tax=Arachis stenosperma TaxID=217475 RepID=UPI0025ACDCCB|nr:probable methyltransferase At1g29790 [Arachis stenosperma]
MAEGLKEKAEQNYVRLFGENLDLKKELARCREAFQELEDSMAEGSEEAWRIFKEHVRVITVDLDLSPLDPDKIMVDGAIVSPPQPEIDSDLKTRGQRIVESPPQGDVPSSSRVPPQGPDQPTPSSPSAVLTSLPVDPSPGGGDLPSGDADPPLLLPNRAAQTLIPSPSSPFPSSLPDFSVIWDHYPCKSFNCFHRQNPNLGFNPSFDSSKFTTYKTDLDLPISQLFQIAKSTKSVIRLGFDVGGGTGSFAATTKLRNMTVVTTTMRMGVPYSEAVALRGLVPLHVPLQQRLPVFDGVVDLVRCGCAVNRWIPVTMMEFLLFDVDRVLRGGGYLWIDRFFSKGVDLEKLYAPLIGKLGYKKVK